jgi:uncharacterized paraquat-inducible protein A
LGKSSAIIWRPIGSTIVPQGALEFPDGFSPSPMSLAAREFATALEASLRQATESPGLSADLPPPSPSPPEEASYHTPETNKYIVWVTLGVVLVTLVAGALDGTMFRKRHRSSMHAWTMTLLVTSYALLVPGLCYKLYSYKVSMTIMGISLPIRGGSETMLQQIHDMYDSGLVLAPILVVFYAMFIPALKVLMLIVGMAMQHSDIPPRVSWARRLLLTVRQVSKWASPDMFAYILMMNLFRDVNSPPKISSDMSMGIGFTCFCVFCVGSTVSSLGIKVPAKLVEDGDGRAAVDGRRSRKLRARRTGAMVATVFVPLFVVFFCIGFFNPCMSLRMDMDLLYKQQPALLGFKKYIDDAHLERLLRADVSMLHCIFNLATWFAEGDGNSGIALAMYGIFVSFFTLADMFALFVMALKLRGDSGIATARKSKWVSRIAGKLCMLDVSVVGVLIIVLALQDFREKGITVGLRWGIWSLFAAEFVHYLTSFLIHRQFDAPVGNKNQAEGSSSDSSEGASDDIDYAEVDQSVACE